MFSGKSYDGEVGEGSWRIEPTRLFQTEATVAGQKTIASGRWVATGREMLPLNKCGS